MILISTEKHIMNINQIPVWLMMLKYQEVKHRLIKYSYNLFDVFSLYLKSIVKTLPSSYNTEIFNFN